MNNLENKDILSDDIFVAINMIIDSCPEVVFGGSIALNAVGLLNRKIGDIDVFVSHYSSLAKNGFMSIPITDSSFPIQSDTVTDINGKQIQRTSIKVNNIKVCCFKVDAQILEHTNFTFKNTTIKIQNVNHAIAAKVAYAKHNSKHKVDLYDISEVLFNKF